MTIGDKVKVKEEFKEMLAAMPEFSKIDLGKTMTVVDFESTNVLVKENSKKWKVNWLEPVIEEVKSSAKKNKK